MAWKNLVILFFSLTLGGCCTFILPYYTTEFNSDRPKVNRFALSKKGPGDTSLIDFDAIYLKYGTIEYNTVDGYKKMEEYSCIRFFKTGQVLRGWIDSLNQLSEFNNLEMNSVGYYHISNDTIYLEQYITGAHFCERYHIGRGKITKDSLIFNDGEAVYKRHKVAGLEGTPSW